MATPNKMPKLSEKPDASSVSDEEEVELVDEPSANDVADGEADVHVDDMLSGAMDGCSLPNLDRSLGTSNSNPTSSEEVAAGGAGVRMEVWCESHGINPPSPIGSQETSPDGPQKEAHVGVEFEPEEGGEVVNASIDGGMAMPASNLKWDEMEDFWPHQEDEDVLRYFARMIAEDNLAWVSSNDDGPAWDNFADWAEVNGLPRPSCLFPQYECDFLGRLHLRDGY